MFQFGHGLICSGIGAVLKAYESPTVWSSGLNAVGLVECGRKVVAPAV